MMSWRRLTLPPISACCALLLVSCATPPGPRPVETPSAAAIEPSAAGRPSDAAPAVGEDQPVLVGTVLSVTDGDTIKVQLSSGPITVRFDSIDAPEKSQPWGREAYAALYQRLSQQVVALDVTTQDRYERLVATVYLEDENINGWLVQQGHAWAYRQYLNDKDYCIWEASARTSNLGLWSLPATSRYAPWEWRKVQRGDAGGFTDYSSETADRCIGSMRRSGRGSGAIAPLERTSTPMPPSGSCMIKGNISQNGRIYHVPGSPSYNSTKIDESSGERWFCTEAEAQAAGWRAPKR
jgi:endonuclease YncB( thermonuclease family)